MVSRLKILAFLVNQICPSSSSLVILVKPPVLVFLLYSFHPFPHPTSPSHFAFSFSLFSLWNRYFFSSFFPIHQYLQIHHPMLLLLHHSHHKQFLQENLQTLFHSRFDIIPTAFLHQDLL